ncbi:hypothetical protein BEL04_10175 [Mucilaginibacter sp. PPCGB 2223]|uniref:hypothetical protein n=1 Tax=Mucilaginibacter sp. PPCGB 2223 TaxID=1886027 RepID=UPI00082673B3|nr:hypothetical protein [Mucilaginibacter sp. PPCGB 2223]OCX54588.1 hypothetical protein BEL04_10175 [Mucilaginibacter sp. PPCGB 2223]
MKRVSGFGVFIILFAGFLILSRRGKYSEFHHDKIDGAIDTIYRYRDYIMLTVNKKEYRIIPQSINSTEWFDHVAHPGDTVHKAADRDTLTLSHLGAQYRYTVQKW